jgi:hypothetical protein
VPTVPLLTKPGVSCAGAVLEVDESDAEAEDAALLMVAEEAAEELLLLLLLACRGSTTAADARPSARGSRAASLRTAILVVML